MSLGIVYICSYFRVKQDFCRKRVGDFPQILQRNASYFVANLGCFPTLMVPTHFQAVVNFCLLDPSHEEADYFG